MFEELPEGDFYLLEKAFPCLQTLGARLDKKKRGDFEIHVVTGGLTNKLYKVKFCEKDVLVRIFGEGTGEFSRDYGRRPYLRPCLPRHLDPNYSEDFQEAELKNF